MTKDGQITVAIITARRDDDTTYDVWHTLRNAFLAGRSFWTHPITKVEMPFDANAKRLLGGEFGALLAACLAEPSDYHVDYQIRALSLQTRIPDRIIVISRTQDPGFYEIAGQGVVCYEPMLSSNEVIENPLSGLLVHPQFKDLVNRRRRDVSFGCADKNTALLVCQTEYLVVLDDCCLPGFGVVEAAYNACVQGDILRPTHRQMFLPIEERPALEHADANTGPDGHQVMGIWGGPLSYFLAINGWNTDLDTQRGGLDAELMLRMDRYLKMRNRSYVYQPHTKVYELEHTYPWGSKDKSLEWEDLAPEGCVAPGPSLKDLRDAIQRGWPLIWGEEDDFTKELKKLDEALYDRIDGAIEDVEDRED